MESLKYITENAVPLSKIPSRIINKLQCVYVHLSIKRFKESHKPFHVHQKEKASIIGVRNTSSGKLQYYASSYEISTSIGEINIGRYKSRINGKTLNRLSKFKEPPKLSSITKL